MNSANVNSKVQATDISSVKPGMKKGAAKTAAQRSIFEAIDKNGDGVISKSEAQNGVVKGKVKNSKGQFVEREYVKIKDLPNNRSLVIDKNGKQWVRAHDGVILSDSYVKNGFKTTKKPKSSASAKNKQSLTKTTNFLAKEYNSALKSFNAQMEKDGWAGDLADGISRAWTWATDSKNSANYVREDLKTQKKNIKDLQNAAKQGQAQFNAKFKQIYGVNYNQQAMDAYMANPTEANYKKAFGSKVRNIKTRVAKYNQSQDTGAVAVKTTAKVGAGIAIGVATGGTGLVALGTAATVTAAASVAIEETDALKVTDMVTKGKVEFRKGTDHTKILKDAAWDGVSVLAGGAVSKVAGTVIKGTGKMATVGRAAFDVAGDVAVGAAQEYVETGKVSTTGVVTNAVMSGVGNVVVSGASKVISKGFGTIKRYFGNFADNVSHRFSTNKADFPPHLLDADGNVIAGGGGKSLWGKIKSKFSSTDSNLMALREQNPANYHAAVNNGLSEAIDNGKVPKTILNNLSSTGARDANKTANRTISQRVIDALDMDRCGGSLVTTLDAGVNPSTISRHVSDGGVCAIGNKLYVNDGGRAVPLKLSREKFDDLFPPLGTAVIEQNGLNNCWLVSHINTMMDSSSGRVKLYTMLEQSGDDVVVNLRRAGNIARGEAPTMSGRSIRFDGGIPANVPDARLGQGAAPGLELIEQAVLVDNFVKASHVKVDNISALSADQLAQEAGRLSHTDWTASGALQGVRSKRLSTAEQITEGLSNFRPGHDTMTATWETHSRSIVNYDPASRTVTYHDPYSAGVDLHCSLDEFLQKSPQVFTTKAPTQPTVRPETPSVRQQLSTPTEVTNNSSLRSDIPNLHSGHNQAIELTNRPIAVSKTADGNLIKASVTQSNVIIVKDGKYTRVPIPENGAAESILEKSTDTFLIIKNDNGKVSITKSDTPDLPRTSTTRHVSQPTNSTPVRPAQTTTTSSVRPKPQLEMPAGFRDNGLVLGKRAIINSEGVVMYESKGTWKRLN